MVTYNGVNKFQTPICPLQICSLSISCYSFLTCCLIIRKLMNLTDDKQRGNWPFIMFFFMNRERKMGERKIGVTAILRHAPSMGAEFVASDFLNFDTVVIFLLKGQSTIISSLIKNYRNAGNIIFQPVSWNCLV